MAISKEIVELIIRAQDESRQTVDELLKSMDDLEKAEANAAKGTKDQREAMRKLDEQAEKLVDSFRELEKQDRLIEQFRQQSQATKKAGREWRSLKAEVDEFRKNVTAVGPPSKEVAAEMERLGRAVDFSAERYEKQRKSLARQSAELQRNGIAARNIVATQGRIRHAMDRARASLKRNRDAWEKNRKQLDAFNRSAAKSLPLVARLRSEVVTLAATFIGFRGLQNITQELFDVARAREAAESRLRFGLGGDGLQAAKELQFVDEQAERLGLDIAVLREEYSKLVASTQGILEQDEVRKVFLGIAEAARVLFSTNEDLRGQFRAITQVFSKNKVQAEELRGQLGDRLVGATLLFADANKLSTEELEKLLETGQLTAKTLLPFADELSRKVATELPEAIRSADAEANRFTNTMLRLKEETALGGFVDELKVSLRELSEELKNEETREGAQELAKLLGLILKVGVEVIKNLDVLVPILVTFTAARFVSWLVKIGLSARKTAQAIGILRGAIMVFGGPAGAVVAAGTGLAFLIANLRDARDEMEEFKSAVETAEASLSGLTKPQLRSGLSARLSAVADLTAKIAELEEQQRLELRNSSDLGVSGRFIELGRELEAAREELAKLDAESNAFFKALLNQNLDNLQEPRDTSKKSGFPAGPTKDQLAGAELLVKDALDRQARLNEEAFDDQKKSIKAFYAERQRIEENAIDLQIQAKQRELEAAKKVGNTAKIEAELTILRQKRADVSKLAAREQAEAEEELVRKVEELRNRLLSAQGNETQASINELKQQFEEEIKVLLANGDEAGAELARKLFSVEKARVQFDALEQEFSRVMENLSAHQQRLQTEVLVGDKTQISAAAELNHLREQARDQLSVIIEKMRELAEASGDPRLVQGIANMELQLQSLRKSVDATAQKINTSLASGATSAFADFVTGAQSARDAFRQFAADFLKQIADMILQQALLNALQQGGGAGGGIGGLISKGISAIVAHDGAKIGRSGGRRRVMSPLEFMNAPRYHRGGMVGIKPDERAAVLQVGEEVLARNDPRNALNGGGRSSGGVQQTIINTIDPDEVTQAGLQSSATDEVLINKIGRNKDQIKNLLGN